MNNNIILQGISSKELILKIDEIIKVRIEELSTKLQKTKYSEIEYLTGKEVEDLLRISSPTRYSWEKKGLFSRYKIAGKVRYQTSEILSVLERIDN